MEYVLSFVNVLMGYMFATALIMSGIADSPIKYNKLLIEECQQALPRNQVCELKAVVVEQKDTQSVNKQEI